MLSRIRSTVPARMSRYKKAAKHSLLPSFDRLLMFADSASGSASCQLVAARVLSQLLAKERWRTQSGEAAL